MIELVNIKKNYETANGVIEALRGVSLQVERSDIFGVIGYSGAGKSTLIRCINLLERPDSGIVRIDGRDITACSQAELGRIRQDVGMIFQHFNLLKSKTVFENVAFPLRYQKKSEQEIRKRVGELLDIVELGDRGGSYPSQLSGGQKQRVAIARALANNPKILLSDEATSALDPQTTASILGLLQELNRKLGLTIVLITHEMNVVKAVCNKIAVMEHGNIVEQGATFSVLSDPQAAITKKFTAALFRENDAVQLLQNERDRDFLRDGKLLHLLFVGGKANNAYIVQTSRAFQVDISILYGSIELIQGQPIGSLFVSVSGSDEQISGAVNYLQSEGIRVSALETISQRSEHDA